MRQVNAGGVAGRFIAVEGEGLAGLQLDGGVGELADAQLRSLKVGEDADRATTGGFDISNALDQRPQHLMARMAHVDAEKIRACLVQLGNHLLVGGCRAECGKDLNFAVSPHQFWPSWDPDVSESWTIQLP